MEHNAADRIQRESVPRQEIDMKIAELMTKDVRVTSPDQTLREAARLMSEEDVGILPVAEDDRLVGVITDRDIAIRAVAEGKGPRTKVRQVMTNQVRYCFQDEDVDHVSRNMANIQMRRLPVMDRDKRLVGIVSLGDLATEQTSAPHAQQALSGVSQPGR
jgi:CBS domain-containing protein